VSTAAMGGESLWIATTPSTSFPPLSGDVEVDVAVVGAGITGITCGLLLKRAGKRVALLEMKRVARGASGYTTAKLTSGHRLIYATLEKKLGREGARLYAEANEAAIALIKSLVAEHGIECDLEQKPNYVYAEKGESAGQIEEEAAAAQRAGLPASIVTETTLPFPVAAAVCLPEQAQFHPRKYMLALADRIPGDGSHVFEQTRATDVIQGSPCVVETERGRVLAGDVVLATHLPFEDKGLFFAKAHPSRSYAVAAPVDDKRVPEGMFINVESPDRSLRTARSDGGLCLIVGGEGHKPGEEGDTRQRYTHLEDWARQWFGVERIAFRWSTQDFISVDHVPFVGPLVPGADHVWVATAFGKWGMTNGTAAATTLADRLSNRETPPRNIFDSNRLGSVLTKKLVTENAAALRHLVGDRLSLPGLEAIEGPSPGDGVVARIDGASQAISMTDSGDLLAVSAVCTHMGCLVAWNTAERTWDCPCHGSRYLPDGTVIEGPAVKDLEARDPVSVVPES
jgi:glycine/D-amino acid oxidase-like deaminating enzyme/nitrite reductase/ring-hydroxylating ferredoxin subunit